MRLLRGEFRGLPSATSQLLLRCQVLLGKYLLYRRKLAQGRGVQDLLAVLETPLGLSLEFTDMGWLVRPARRRLSVLLGGGEAVLLQQQRGGLLGRDFVDEELPEVFDLA